MAADDTAPADPYASQKANIRDTVKYLAGAYAACGTLLFAGLSLSHIGGTSYPRLTIIVVAGCIAFGFVLASVRAIFQTLQGDFCFPHAVPQAAKDFLQPHARDLFPLGFADYGAMLRATDNQETAVESIRTRWLALPPGPAQDPARAILRSQYDDAMAVLRVYNAAVARAVGLAHLFMLQQRLTNLQPNLARWTIGAILATLVAAYAITMPDKPDCSRCIDASVTTLA